MLHFEMLKTIPDNAIKTIVVLLIAAIMCLAGCGSTEIEDTHILDNLQENNSPSVPYDVWDNDIIYTRELNVRSMVGEQRFTSSCLFDSKSVEEGSFVPNIGNTDTVGDYYQTYFDDFNRESSLYSFSQAHETLVEADSQTRYYPPVSSYDGSVVIWGGLVAHNDGIRSKLYCYDSTKKEINILYETPLMRPCYAMSPNGRIVVVSGLSGQEYVGAMIVNGKATDLFPNLTIEINTENGNSIISINENPLFAVAVDDIGNALLADINQGVYYSFCNGELKKVANGKTFCMNRKHDKFIITDNGGVFFYSFGWDEAKKINCGEMEFLEVFIPETMKYQTNYLLSLPGCRIYGIDNFNRFCFENEVGDLIRIDDFDKGEISIFKKNSSLGGWVLYSSCGMQGFNPYLAFSKDFTNMIYADASGLYRLELTSASSVPELIYTDDEFMHADGEFLESGFLYSNDQKHIIIADNDKIISYDCDSHQARIVAEGEVAILAISRKYEYMICTIDDETYIVRDNGQMEQLHDLGDSLTCFQIGQEEELVNVWSYSPSFMETVRGNVLFTTTSEKDDHLSIYRLDENVKAIKVADTTDW